MDFRTFVVQFFMGGIVTTGCFFFLRSLRGWQIWQFRMLFLILLSMVNVWICGLVFPPILLLVNSILLTMCYTWQFFSLTWRDKALLKDLIPYPVAVSVLAILILLPAVIWCLYAAFGIMIIKNYIIPSFIFYAMLTSVIRSEGREAIFTAQSEGSLILNLINIAFFSFLDGQIWGGLLLLGLKRLVGLWFWWVLFRLSLFSAFVGWVDFIRYRRWREY